MENGELSTAQVNIKDYVSVSVVRAVCVFYNPQLAWVGL